MDPSSTDGNPEPGNTRREVGTPFTELTELCAEMAKVIEGDERVNTCIIILDGDDHVGMELMDFENDEAAVVQLLLSAERIADKIGKTIPQICQEEIEKEERKRQSQE